MAQVAREAVERIRVCWTRLHKGICFKHKRYADPQYDLRQAILGALGGRLWLRLPAACLRKASAIVGVRSCKFLPAVAKKF